MKKKVKKTNIILNIIITFVLIVVAVGLVLVGVNILKMQKDYLIFSVSDSQEKLIRTSINNNFEFNKTYAFDINYVFAEDADNKRTWDYNVSITGCQKLALYQGEYPVQFDKLDLSKAFKIEKKDKQFTITIPSANEFFEIIFEKYLDSNKNNVYIFDICDIDYFSLNIMSYNKKDVISYKFHLSNKNNEIVDINNIILDKNTIDFYTQNENTLTEILIDKIVVNNEEIDFGGKNA